MVQHQWISDIIKEKPIGQKVCVKGWIRTFRNNLFIALNDGSTQTTIQVVIDRENTPEDVQNALNPGTAIEAMGTLVESQGRGQSVEIQADTISIIGHSSADSYPLQPKKHSNEFLRTIAHLRMRTNTFGAVFRIRHNLAYAIHEYFHNKGFFYMHSPIVTASDAEGAGEMFRVTTLEGSAFANDKTGETDFFGKKTYLTVSGQLEAESGAQSLGRVYTFGPTFRAEQSHTTRHLAEFWMIEPEIAFADLDLNMDLAEDLLKYTIKAVMDRCAEDLDFLHQRQENEEKQLPQNDRSFMPLKEKLQFCLENDFERLSYTEAVNILLNSKPNKKKKFKYVLDGWGADLQSEHERYLVEKHFKKPVILYDYPKDIKAFYMRLNEDGKTVRAMDILFPGIGEIVGGSQREERLDHLLDRMKAMNIPEENLWWYLDLRKYGTTPHSGFGLGFERLVQFVTGMKNIRDVIAFPRYPGNAEF